MRNLHLHSSAILGAFSVLLVKITVSSVALRWYGRSHGGALQLLLRVLVVAVLRRALLLDPGCMAATVEYRYQ